MSDVVDVCDLLDEAEKLLRTAENHARWEACVRRDQADEIAAFLAKLRVAP